MNSVSSFINAVILSAIITVSATPLLFSLKRKGVHPILAYTITLILVFAVFIAIAVFVILAITQFVEAIPEYTEEFEGAVDSVTRFFQSLGISEGINLEVVAQVLNPGKVLAFAADFFANLLAGLSDVFLVALIVIFLLVDALGLPDKIASYIQTGDELVTRVFNFGADVRRYVLVTTIVGLATGVWIPFSSSLWGLIFRFYGERWPSS